MKTSVRDVGLPKRGQNFLITGPNDGLIKTEHTNLSQMLNRYDDVEKNATPQHVKILAWAKEEARKRGIEDEAAVRVPKAPTVPSSSHPVFSNSRKADDIMNLVASLSMKATMTIRR